VLIRSLTFLSMTGEITRTREWERPMIAGLDVTELWQGKPPRIPESGDPGAVFWTPFMGTR
jgi:hypothetical protein